MFRAGQPNPYDDIVVKTTDENLTSENWELILNLCDKVVEEGDQGARNVIASVLKRLAHRNPNVQLYALALVEALSKNCGIEVHREIASRSFTQALERIITDRTIHDKVKKKALSLILMWTTDFEKDPTLGVMEECYEGLKSKGYKFEESHEPPPPQVDDEIRRREEEELQRVLEMSVLDKGGRNAWDSYGGSSGGDTGGAGPSSSKHTAGPSRTATASTAGSSSTVGKTDFGYAKAASGYVPARTPSPQAQTPVVAVPGPAVRPFSATTSSPASFTHAKNSSQASLPLTSVSRVRALHSFEGTEQGELTFEKGDVIKVVDRNYKDWWRGQLKGRTGIFPVNYAELLPDPTPEEIAKEAEQEATVFAQAANIDRLLSMLRGLDPAKDNLADNEEIQELYRSSMSLRPKIVKLIDKYSQKRSELVSMNETFVKARTMFDRMMEESLARHSGLYDGRPPFQQAQQSSFRPDSRAQQDYRASTYGPMYDQPGYAGFPQAKPAYPVATPTPGPQPYVDPNAAPYAAQQQPYSQPYPAQQGAPPYTQAQQPVGPYGPYAQPVVGQGQPTPHPQQQQAQVQTGPQAQPHQQSQNQPQVQPQPHQQQPQPYTQAQAPGQLQPHQNGYQEPAAAQPQPQSQSQPQQQPQQQQQPQPDAQAQAPPGTMQGPPYVYDPSATYPDPNAQAWAQYYAQGGTDLTGAVYFISVPGLTDKQESAASQPQPQPQPQGQQQHPGQQSPQQSREPQNGPSVSPAENTQFYQGQHAQQPQQPGGEQVPGYSAHQQHPQPMHNGSSTSVNVYQTAPGAGPGGEPQYAAGGAPQHQQPQPAANSPTLSHTGSYYGAPQVQPSSPGGASQHPPTHQQQQQQQQYPPNPYPNHSGVPPGGHEPAQPPYNAQFAQMHGQFSAMGMGEPRSPTGVAPPQMA